MFAWLSDILGFTGTALIALSCVAIITMFAQEVGDTLSRGSTPKVDGKPGKPSDSNTLGGKHHAEGSRKPR
jgi:hypothetical protein